MSVRAPSLGLVALVALVVGACSERPPGSPTSRSVIQQEHLPNTRLTTHEGRSVRFYDDLVKGKVVAINFMFTSCRIACPVTTPKLVEVQKLLGERSGRDVTFLSITLDPEHDTPEVLRTYARAYGAGPGWYFLTGKQNDIERLRRKLGVYDLNPVVDADRTQHAGILVLGNEPRGRWKAVATLSKPVRIRQAIERTILPPNQWPTGQAVVNEVPYEVKEAVEPVDLSALPKRD
ncbi:MAG: SCO family protein [Candidatus Rokuibacteriota bacterium]|nr:MAG: SCO family protein [Candidatus Rokubacteria bacterium]